MTIENLIKTYSDYTNEQLLEIHANLNDYSSDAKKALLTVMKKRGGFDELLDGDIESKEIQIEIARVKKELRQLLDSNADVKSSENKVYTNLLSDQQMDKIIQEINTEIDKDFDIKKTKPPIKIRILAITFASLPSGIIWGLASSSYGSSSSNIPPTLLMCIGVLCFIIIGFFDKAYGSLFMIIFLTIISVICSILIGQVIYNFLN